MCAYGPGYGSCSFMLCVDGVTWDEAGLARVTENRVICDDRGWRCVFCFRANLDGRKGPRFLSYSPLTLPPFTAKEWLKSGDRAESIFRPGPHFLPWPPECPVTSAMRENGVSRPLEYFLTTGINSMNSRTRWQQPPTYELTEANRDLSRASEASAATMSVGVRGALKGLCVRLRVASVGPW